MVETRSSPRGAATAASSSAGASTATTQIAPPASARLSLNIKTWHGVGAWTWGAGDAGDVCGICRIAYDGCPPDAKFPGDDSPVVWGTCAHAYHLQCITKWLSGQGAEPRCPLCRQPWEFKQL
mmetsp:Transcript_1310/g.4109  ORF Transcript_1310/g.4109 Transcript_1310/m.4109 type:complete len:123 (+) Transcript_1310:334-702(+)